MLPVGSSSIRTYLTVAVNILLMALGLGLVLPVEAQTESKDPRWQYSAPGRLPTIVSSPAIGPDHTVYVGVINGTEPETGLLMAIRTDTATPTSKWPNLPGGFQTRGALYSGIESSPAISADGSTVYFGCNDGRLYAVRTADGTQRWAYLAGTTHAIFTSPVLGADGTIYFGTTDLGAPKDSKFYAVNPDGTFRWAIGALGGFEASAAVGADGTVYYGSLDANVYAVDGGTGREKWRRTLNGPVEVSPAIARDGTVYVGSDAGDLVALDPDSGAVKWRLNVTVGGGVALGADGTLYVGSIEPGNTGMLHAFTPEGRPKAGFTPFAVAGPIVSVPAIRADGTIVFSAGDTRLHVLNPDGTEKWNATLDRNDIESSPVVDTDGAIYVATTAGTLFSFAGSGAGLSEYSAWPMLNRDARHTGRAAALANEGILMNLSTRGTAGPLNPLIAGFVLSGGGPQQVLVRAVGPTLARFGLGNPLPDPILTGYDGASVVIRNNDWSTNPSVDLISEVTARVGGFALPSNSKDSAVLTAFLPKDTYTGVIESADGQAGVVLAELYDTEMVPGGSRLRNVSTRGLVGSGDNVLIAGLVTGGPGKIRVLVRGVGPGLARFNVTGLLPRPVLKVFNENSVLIATNTVWTDRGARGDISAAANLAGAFAFDETSADSALILALDPGAYTVQLSGVNGDSGVGLVEVYALPD